MQEAYRSGDSYLTFAKQAGAVPADATKRSHGPQRELFRQCVLGVQYGMEAHGLAMRIGRPPIVARDLLRAHHETYRTFWRWSDAVVDTAMLTGSLHTVFGWRVHLGPSPIRAPWWPPRSPESDRLGHAGSAVSFTCSSTLRAMSRKPLCLISCSHASPEGGWGALVGRHGAMKPAGKARECRGMSESGIRGSSRERSTHATQRRLGHRPWPGGGVFLHQRVKFNERLV
jgi:hypothetical protein